MEKTEQPVVAVSSSSATLDFAAKKLARELDFTPGFRAPVQQFSAHPLPVQPVQAVLPVARPALSAAVKPETSRPQPQAAVAEIKDGTPKKQKQCNCKNSRCLKLYCECFASGIYCDGCNCINCHNNVEHEAARQEAVVATLERNPNAFRPKIANSPHGTRVGKQVAGPAQVVGKHNKGCNCKKTGCLKKYCECFQANILCSDNCKCNDCKNFEGSEERRALFHGSNGNSMIYQEANAAINGAIGFSGFGNSPTSRKRRSQESSSVGMYNNQPVYHSAQYTQGNHVKCSSSSLPPEPISCGVRARAASKVTYRSPLSGIIQPHDVKELCSLLVMVSEEAAKTFADTNKNIENQEKNGVKTSNDIKSEEKLDAQREPAIEKGVPENVSTDGQAIETYADNPGLDESGLQYGRPASPGTVALMCYEQDTATMEVGSPRGITSASQNVAPESSHQQNVPESFAEQERMVLTKFRDFLNRLITCGSIQETMCSSITGSETGTQAQHHATSDCFENGHLSNGIVKPLVPIANHAPSRVARVAFGSNNGFVGHPIQNHMIKPKTEKAVQQ